MSESPHNGHTAKRSVANRYVDAMDGRTKQILRVVLAAIAIFGLLWLLIALFTFSVAPYEVGVKQNNIAGGIVEKDFGPGYHFKLPMVHRSYTLDRRYRYLHYSPSEQSSFSPLTIRTRDNNNVVAEVSIPIRIVDGGGHLIVSSGLHIADGYIQRAHNTIVGVLRERLAQLSSEDWYNVERRQIETAHTLEALNIQLEAFHVKAEGIYLRAFSFPENYENQLQEIQLLQQQSLLDRATERRANAQQQLDNFVQETQSLVNQREAWWDSQQAVIESAYRTGITGGNSDEFFDAFVNIALVNRANEMADQAFAPGSEEYDEFVGGLRRELEASFAEPQYAEGIEGINARANREIAELEGESESLKPRYEAEASRVIAEIENDGKRRINSLLASAGGRSLVALEAAENLQFEEELTFHSSDIPFILNLEQLARVLMGR